MRILKRFVSSWHHRFPIPALLGWTTVRFRGFLGHSRFMDMSAIADISWDLLKGCLRDTGASFAFRATSCVHAWVTTRDCGTVWGSC